LRSTCGPAQCVLLLPVAVGVKSPASAQLARGRGAGRRSQGARAAARRAQGGGRTGAASQSQAGRSAGASRQGRRLAARTQEGRRSPRLACSPVASLAGARCRRPPLGLRPPNCPDRKREGMSRRGGVAGRRETARGRQVRFALLGRWIDGPKIQGYT
jgi:hypothetical protein